MTLTLVAAHDAAISKPALVPIPGGVGWPDSGLPEGLTGEDVARISAAIAARRAESTRKTYASAWRRFERWCADRTIPPLPATPATVCAYLAEFATQGVAAAGTIEGACAAIAAEHSPPAGTSDSEGCRPGHSTNQRAVVLAASSRPAPFADALTGAGYFQT